MSIKSLQGRRTFYATPNDPAEFNRENWNRPTGIKIFIDHNDNCDRNKPPQQCCPLLVFPT